MSEAQSSRPSGGGTGFLFGNIDRRGRLDEDYMDDDAKDHLDNVAPTVADRDPNLREITAAVPKTADAAPGSEPNSPTEHNDDAQDYYDDADADADDIMIDMDQSAKSALAARALADANAGVTRNSADDEDDENYDDEDGDEATTHVPAPPPLKPISSLPPPPALVRFETPPASGDKDPNSGQVHSPSKKYDGVTTEERLQLELMEAARRGSSGAVATGVPVDDKSADGGGAFPSDRPLRFSEVLARPARRLPSVARRKRYGVVPAAPSAAASPLVNEDEATLLERPPPAPRVDATKLFLQTDVAYKEESRFGMGAQFGQRRFGPPGVPDESRIQVESSEYLDAAAPLVLDDDEAGRIVEETEQEVAKHSMLEQAAWEADIDWGGDDADSCDTSDADDNDARPAQGANGDGGAGTVEKNKQNEQGAGADSDDDEDEDDMEWEDGDAGAGDAPAVELTNAQPPAKNGSDSTAGGTEKAQTDERDPASQAVRDSLGASEAPSLKEKVNPSASELEKAGAPRAEDGATSMDKKEDSRPKVGFKDVGSLGNTGFGGGEKQVVQALRVKDPLIGGIIAPNADLVSGAWLDDVAWDTDASGESDITLTGSLRSPLASPRRGVADRLILDMNDKSMVLEHVDSRDGGVGTRQETQSSGPHHPGHESFLASLSAPGLQVQFNVVDPFNVSNDPYYARTMGNSMLKVDRRAILRGLRNAPPAVKAQTSEACPSDSYLQSFHRPRFSIQSDPSHYELVPLRRKRPKGGSSQIAGQIPKKQNELWASAKDAYRVCVLEFALEHAPSLVPVPGMASKVVTYERKESSAAAAQARKDATGTPDADTVFLSPEEMPPLHAGDLTAGSKPLLVLESHLFSAPCTRLEAAPTDFLVMSRKGKTYVREIDSLLSVGVTEPKVEVMAPNSDRFKKFSRDRVSLWLLRELLKSQKGAQKLQKDGAEEGGSIDRDHLFGSFPRRRSFPETSLIKLLKDLTKYQGGKYNLIAEPPKGFAAMEAEWLRAVSPEETCAFEAMEAGWFHLFSVGVHKLTHPNQANIRAAAEKCGLKAGPAVGAFIRNQLLHVPWYRSQIMIAAQKQQRKELLQALASARIVNDLREGGSIMERRIASLTSAEAANVLVNPYRVQTRKIPAELEARRKLVYEMTLRKSKSTEPVNYEKTIATVIEKQHNVNANRTAAGAGVTAAVIAAGVMILPLALQREALEDGVVDNLPREVDRASSKEDPAAAAKLAAGSDDAFGTSAAESNKGAEKRANSSGGGLESNGKGLKGSSSKAVDNDSTGNQKKTPGKAKKPKSLSADVGQKSSKPVAKRPSGEDGVSKNKKVVRLKVTRKIRQPDGTLRPVTEIVTDPEEVDKILAKSKNKAIKKKVSSSEKDGSASRNDEGSASAGGSKLKININIGKLSQGVSKPSAKSGSKTKAGSSSAKGKRSSADGQKASGEVGASRLGGSGGATNAGSVGGVKRVVQKGHIGKIKINQKAVREAQEAQAAKRKRSQYGEDIDYPARKATKKSATSRRKRNGGILLNGILEEIEKAVRETEGYVEAEVPVMKIVRLREGAKAPIGRVAKNLARPEGTFLDFTGPVNTKVTPAYKEIVKKQMYLDLIKHKCKQMKYSKGEEFLNDFKLLLSNARAFNVTPDVGWVVQHAELLLEVANEQMEKRKDEIEAAEAQVSKVEAPSGKAEGPSTTRTQKDNPPTSEAPTRAASSKKQGNSRSADAKLKSGEPSSSKRALDEKPSTVDCAPFPGGIFGGEGTTPLPLLGGGDDANDGAEMEPIPDGGDIFG